MYALSKRISRKFIKVITAPTDQKNLVRNSGVQNLCKRPIKFSVVHINKVSCLCDTLGYCITCCVIQQGIALHGCVIQYKALH